MSKSNLFSPKSIAEKKKEIGREKADQFLAFMSRGRELFDGLHNGNDESETCIGQRKSQNPREGAGANSGSGNGLRDGASELH